MKKQRARSQMSKNVHNTTPTSSAVW